MTDHSKRIFGNPVSAAAYDKAKRSKESYINKFGDDSDANYQLTLKKNDCLYDDFNLYNLCLSDNEGSEINYDTKKGIIVGNIRMGFGHYRISMAMASAAHDLGYTPYWFDLNSFPTTTATKIISAQNELYSLGSRISQKNKLFNKVVWEPMNYDGFKHLSYNSSDQKNAELMTPLFKSIPKDMPFIGTHVWPAQAAIHSGMKHVVNAIPDNWPMALHLAEGSIHTVQTHNAYYGYRTLNGFQGDHILKPMPHNSIYYTGHYIDAELVHGIESDCDARIARSKANAPVRFLLTIGGAGAQQKLFTSIISYLIPAVKKHKASLIINFGDHLNVLESIMEELPELDEIATMHINNWDESKSYTKKALESSSQPDHYDPEIEGLHVFAHDDIYEAVYSTNLLMRACDVLVTKPSELAFYPIPKLFIEHVGGHEKWGAIHSTEIGDGCPECSDIPHTLQMLSLFIRDRSLIEEMCQNIKKNKKLGIYDGAYKAVKLAFGESI